MAEEAAKFQVGDFSDPEANHGSAMPGLAALKAGFDQIDVELLGTATGAAITYATRDPELISAIHLWFEAQTSDHGSHAEHNPVTVESRHGVSSGSGRGWFRTCG